MIARARELGAGYPDLTFVVGDFITAAGLSAAGDEFICSVSAIHHMDFEAALARMRQMLRPGGTLAVVGLARETAPADWAATIAAAPVVRIAKVLRRVHGPEGMPAADPQMSYGQVRARRLHPATATPPSSMRSSTSWPHTTTTFRPASYAPPPSCLTDSSTEVTL
jgi:hypothetical protein